MVYAMTTMFASPQLEERFRAFELSHAALEIGGYFLGTTRMDKRLQWTKFKQAGGTFAFFIHSWLMLPNMADTPSNKWTAWSLEQAQAAAEFTALSMNLSVLHFHSHPNGNNQPSNADWIFWDRWCDGQGVIVTHAPMRLTTYHVHAKRVGSTAEVESASAGFLSWRTKSFRYLWQDMTGDYGT